MRTLFDTGSEADAASYEKAVELKQQGVSWGDSGRQHWLLLVAYVPVIGLRLAVAEIAGDWPAIGLWLAAREQHHCRIGCRFPRSLTFCTYVEIVHNLT